MAKRKTKEELVIELGEELSEELLELIKKDLDHTITTEDLSFILFSGDLTKAQSKSLSRYVNKIDNYVTKTTVLTSAVIVDNYVKAGIKEEKKATKEVLKISNKEIKERKPTILKSVKDIFKDVNKRSTKILQTGDVTLTQAVQISTKTLASKGITAFVASDGRQWELSAYNEMVIRTTNARTEVMGIVAVGDEDEVDFYIVDNHANECILCRPWEGVTLKRDSSVKGNFPTINDALAGGLLHPNCKHSIDEIFEDEPKPKQKKSQKDLVKKNAYSGGFTIADSKK